MFEQAFKNINDILRGDAGCSAELDYTEQSSWLIRHHQEVTWTS
jgi:type I restriction enzyme M protein